MQSVWYSIVTVLYKSDCCRIDIMQKGTMASFLYRALVR